ADKPEFHDALIDVKLILDKKQGTFLLKFDINGKVQIPCDRCGDEYEMLLWDEFELLVKVIDDDEVARKSEDDAEVAYIGRSESILDVSGYIYEFIILSIPIQHIHPDREDGSSGCNPAVIEFLKKQEVEQRQQVWKNLPDIKNEN
ncbi:MAG TPA: DUF177 domain-containing protein, partial [Chitinophagaceae bacterium]|nr:DUF177 domain-containing protein [Chitinophagaceae bacterium]